MFLVALVTAAVAPRSVAAQAADLDTKIQERWTAILSDVAHQHGLTITGNRLSGSAEEKAAVYKDAIDRVGKDPSLVALAFPDRSLVAQTVRDEDRKYVNQLIQQKAESAQATSVDSRSTNPFASSLTERSGFSQLLALALNARNLFSSDQTGVSLNLSGLALMSLPDPNVYSELYRYQQHSLMRRIGGTVVFGAKVPEHEIIGFSGFPDFDKLLDVFVWDVKVRVWGDRDPRSELWYPLTLGRGGLATQLAADVLGLVPAEDLAMVRDLLSEDLGQKVASIKDRISRSPQLSAKVSGNHLTKEAGTNKYSFGALFDVGAGPTDITANVLYSIVNDVRLDPTQLSQIKQWTLDGSVMVHMLADAIVKGRTVDWSVGGVANLFTNGNQLPVPVSNMWRLFTTIDIPIGDAARVPVSVIYTNDPNALEKSQYISGQIGISYDFSALKKLFANGGT